VAITLIPQAPFSSTQMAQSASWQTANISTVLKNGQIILSPPSMEDDSTKMPVILPRNAQQDCVKI
jgi:hypothetical protein